MRWIVAFFWIGCASVSFSQNVADSLKVIVSDQPRGILSKPLKYSINSSITHSETSLLVKSEPLMFVQSPEQLNECKAHWKSEAVEVEIHGFDHDYFTLIILIYKKTFQVSFTWESDHLEDVRAVIKPTSASLVLSADDFKKGKVFKGHLQMKADCNGNPCENVKFDIDGDFVFTIP